MGVAATLPELGEWTLLRIRLTGTEDMTHGYCISSQVLRI